MTADIDTLHLLGGPAFRQWLVSLLTAEQLGSCLVMALPGADNAATADTLLAAAERLGWIQRSFFAPSVEQQFFGVGGSSGVNHPTTKAHHGQLWAWCAFDRSAIQTFAGDPPPIHYQIGDLVAYHPRFIAQIQGGRSMAKARGRVVGYAFDGRMPRVRWDDDPAEEKARESPYWDGEGNPGRMVPYAARVVGPTAIRKVEGRVRVVVPVIVAKSAPPSAQVPTATPPQPVAITTPPASASRKSGPKQLTFFTL